MEAGYDPIRKRYFMIGKILEPYTWTNLEGEKRTEVIRRYHISFSNDFKSWSSPKMIFNPDEKDSGITQWYGPTGFQTRGDLIVGFLRELRDDKTTEGARKRRSMPIRPAPLAWGLPIFRKAEERAWDIPC